MSKPVTIQAILTQEEAERVKKVKDSKGLTWPDYILEVSGLPTREQHAK